MISNSEESLIDFVPDRYRQSNFPLFPVSPTVHLEEYGDWRTLAMRSLVRSSNETMADFEKRKLRMMGYIGKSTASVNIVREDDITPQMKAEQLASSIEHKRQQFLNKVVQQMEGKPEDKETTEPKPMAKKVKSTASVNIVREDDITPQMKAEKLASSIEHKRQQFLNKVVQQMEGKPEDKETTEPKPMAKKVWKPIPIQPRKPRNRYPKKSDKVVSGYQNTSSVSQCASAPSNIKPFKVLPPIGIKKKNGQHLDVKGQQQRNVKRDVTPIRHTKKSAQMAHQMEAKINTEAGHVQSAVPRTSHALTYIVPGPSRKIKGHNSNKPDMSRRSQRSSTVYDLPMLKVARTFPGFPSALPPIGETDKGSSRISSSDVRKSEKLEISVPSIAQTGSDSSTVIKSVTCSKASSRTSKPSVRPSRQKSTRPRKGSDTSQECRESNADRSDVSVKTSMLGRFTKSSSSSKNDVGSVKCNTASRSTRIVSGANSNTSKQNNKIPPVNNARSSRSITSFVSSASKPKTAESVTRKSAHSSVRKGSLKAPASGLNNGSTNVKKPPHITSSRQVSCLSVKSGRSTTDITPPAKFSTSITGKVSGTKRKERPSTNKVRDATLIASTPKPTVPGKNIARGAPRTTTTTSITPRTVSRSTTSGHVSRSTTTTPRPFFCSTIATPRVVSRSATTTPEPVSHSMTTTPRPVSCSTIATPRLVSRSTTSTPGPVCHSMTTTPRSVSRSTTITHRSDSCSTSTTHRSVSRSTTSTPRPFSRFMTSSPAPQTYVFHSVTSTPTTQTYVSHSVTSTPTTQTYVSHSVTNTPTTQTYVSHSVTSTPTTQTYVSHAVTNNPTTQTFVSHSVTSTPTTQTYVSHSVTSTPTTQTYVSHSVTSTPTTQTYVSHSVTSTPTTQTYVSHSVTSTPTTQSYVSHAVTSTQTTQTYVSHSVTSTPTTKTYVFYYVTSTPATQTSAIR